jgi:oligosaccharide reducing-end xylanase
MKNLFSIILCAMALLANAQTIPWTKGAFETRQYRNVFVEMGYQPDEVDAKLKEVFNDVFRGPNKVYFEVGDTMGYVSDVKNHDARTEGMSYGLMIAVQFGEKDIFDRLWRWSKKYMQHQDGPRKGYFAWSCRTDGTRNAQGAASDGELYFITALLFASNRWGNNTGINYKAEAQHILECIQPREYTPEPRPGGFGGFGGFGGQQQTGPQKMYLIDPETKLITFTPDGFGQRFTDPSYHIPAFYEVWAKWADDGRSDYWKECAQKSREFLHKCIDEKTGLNGDQCQYDGSEMAGFRFPGRPQNQQQNAAPQAPPRNGNNNFRYDSWRVPMNIALDYEWSCADGEWQRQYGEKIQNFFYSQGVDKFVDQYRKDGTLPEGNEILGAGGFRKLRHSIGLVATTAAASVMCSHEKSKEFVDQLWNAKHEPFDDGYFDAYYDGLLRLFAFMHLSGNYRIIFD